MNDDYIGKEIPSYTKLLMFNDLLEYAEKYNTIIDNIFLAKYGFTTLEINWLLENKSEDIKMVHNKIQANVDNKEIKKLKDYIKTLEEENKKLSEGHNDIIGWKGKNSLTIKKLDDKEWLVTEHRKMKHSNDIYKATHYIPIKNVKNVWKIIKMLTDKDNTETHYRAVVRSIIIKYNLDVDIEAFNGGKNRSKYLFPLYYYPLKILEYLNHIEYGGRGSIKRLHFNEVKL